MLWCVIVVLWCVIVVLWQFYGTILGWPKNEGNIGGRDSRKGLRRLLAGCKIQILFQDFQPDMMFVLEQAMLMAQTRGEKSICSWLDFETPLAVFGAYIWYRTKELARSGIAVGPPYFPPITLLVFYLLVSSATPSILFLPPELYLQIFRSCVDFIWAHLYPRLSSITHTVILHLGRGWNILY